MKTLIVVALSFSFTFAQTTIYKGDFTSGNAGAAQVTGGKFDQGWAADAGDGKSDRILFTASKPMSSGFAELKFTVLPNFGSDQFSSDKNIYFSVYKSSQLAQRASGGHYGYVRIRKEASRDYFVEFKAYDRAANESEGEYRVCCRDGWKKYIGKEATIRFTWSDKSNIKLDHSSASGSGSSSTTRPYKVTGIQYVVVGAEGSYGAEVRSFKYQSLTVGTSDSDVSTYLLDPALRFSNTPTISATSNGSGVLFRAIDGHNVWIDGQGRSISSLTLPD